MCSVNGSSTTKPVTSRLDCSGDELTQLAHLLFRLLVHPLICPCSRAHPARPAAQLARALPFHPNFRPPARPLPIGLGRQSRMMTCYETGMLSDKVTGDHRLDPHSPLLAYLPVGPSPRCRPTRPPACSLVSPPAHPPPPPSAHLLARSPTCSPAGSSTQPPARPPSCLLAPSPPARLLARPPHQ